MGVATANTSGVSHPPQRGASPRRAIPTAPLLPQLVCQLLNLVALFI